MPKPCKYPRFITDVPVTEYQRDVDIWVDAFEDVDYSKFTLDQQGNPVMSDYNLL